MTFEQHLKKYLEPKFIKELTASLLEERTTSLFLNTKKMSAKKFEDRYPKIRKIKNIPNGYYYDSKIYPFGKSWMFKNGVYYIMDAASMVTTSFLDLKEDDLVLDMCAAPGGKTISLALKFPNTRIIANDLSSQRSLVLSQNIEHMGIGNVMVTNNDFHNYRDSLKNKFDVILLDAPCSGSAMFRKMDEMRNDWSYEKVKFHSLLQKTLIETAYLLLKPGGTIVYSTCSFSYEEDEEVVLDLLANHPDCKVIPIEKDRRFYMSKDVPGSIHLFPNMFQGEGQYICYIKKEGIPPRRKQIDFSLKNFYGYKLPFNYRYFKGEDIYIHNFLEVDPKMFNVLRCGLFLGEFLGVTFKPSFALSQYVTGIPTIRLDQKEAELYLKGQQFVKKNPYPNGYILVSYDGINLGYVKNVKGTLKNHYPIGLRFSDTMTIF